MTVRAAVVAAVFAGAALVSAPTAAAQDAPLADALQRDLGLSVADWSQRSAVAADLASFADRARADFADSVAGVHLDPSGVGVVDLVPGSAAGAARAAAQHAGFAVRDAVTAAAAPDTLAAGSIADAVSSGGDGIVASSDTGGLRCSVGFNGIDASGAAVVVTAGHCDPNLAAAGTAGASRVAGLDGSPVGTVARGSLDGHDWSVIRLDDDVADRFRNNDIRVPGAAPLDVTGVVDPVVGMPVCKAGATTGYTCGTVTAVGRTVDVGSRVLRDAFVTDICALQGDSGGPLMSGTAAVGVASASNVGQYGQCAVADAVAFVSGTGPQLFATPVSKILEDNPGLRLRTS
ncbi:S1 family peptidase [Rhodococcoides corynebacterioides]|uniref:Trypsin-like serine protease n=1 Tax=Rhodococcoides corynebacterioides TaxID=53972 RepID=A0ABS7P6Q4_9NOCA|nr:S1 family peptidase [Rhodococcus corynebacterioides]MBY6368078.1 trypsin-like serine protease [Rhodococcus corynebacterioides]MBY6406538.1 trypsin-like serine protease [Rhodococcus corynebacterioides]